MANPSPSPETRFKAGNCANPGGKPQGARNRLTKAFLNALADDFDARGKEAIEECRTLKPDAYIKAIAALVPKQVEHSHPLQEMEDADLLAALRALESFLAARADQGGADTTGLGATAH